ncbi:deoxynucleoside kinase-like [Thrips palmi]|uniref:Deoxynucleoside kinase-like n=1 Tax=Thrips palmi TaxID=161013 RepID=A0A6P9AB23_THRPL|nr:deoxynucleoside kinase-like [Thrips palmi]
MEILVALGGLALATLLIIRNICRRSRRRTRVNKIMVYVEGNIGVGKTTLLQKLAEKGYPVVQEPVKLWTDCNGVNFLVLYSKDLPKWAFTFQTLALFSIWHEQAEACGDQPIIIMERSVHSVVKMFALNQFKNGFLSLPQYLLLEKLSQMLSGRFKRREVFIYLHTTAEEAHHRMKLRARSEEAGLSLQYFQQLQEILLGWMTKEEKLQLVVNASQGPQEVFRVVERFQQT